MTEHAELLTEIPLGLSGRIYRSPMPFSPYDRLGMIWTLYWQNGIKTVVVLTEQQEYLEHSRRDLLNFYRSEGMEVIHFPIRDFHAPEDPTALDNVIVNIIERMQNRERIAVHCMAGVGRTGILLACMAKRYLKLDGREAIDWVRQFLPNALENQEQEQFVLAF